MASVVAWRYRARGSKGEWAYLHAETPNDYRKQMQIEQDSRFEFEALYTRKDVIDECVSEIEAVCNFEDYKREELTADYGQPRFDLMNTIIQALELLDSEDDKSTNQDTMSVMLANSATVCRDLGFDEIDKISKAVVAHLSRSVNKE